MQEILRDPSLGFCQRVRHQPSVPLPDDDPQEGQQAAEKAEGQQADCQAEGQEGQQAQPAAAGEEGKAEQESPAGKPSSDVDAQAATAAAAPAADTPAPAAEAPAAADAPTPAAAGTVAAEGRTPLLALPPGASCKAMGDKEWHTFVGNVAKRAKALRRALADPDYVELPRPGSGGALQGLLHRLVRGGAQGAQAASSSAVLQRCHCCRDCYHCCCIPRCCWPRLGLPYHYHTTT